MKSVIAFATPEEMAAASRLHPVTKALSKPAYDDWVLRPEYQPRKFTFPKGQTCIRILPALAGTTGWMYEIAVLAHPNGQHLHPKSFKATGKAKGKSAFDICYSWLRANKPDVLFNKDNPEGFRLLPSPMAICWILVEIEGEMMAKLFAGSAYDGGAAGGNCGVAHQLFKAASELGQTGGHDAAHAEHGVQIIVEKSTPHGSKYPTYQMTRSGMEAPISRYLERMDETEIDAICPLDEVLRRVEAEEEWELLAKVVGEELRDEVRSSTTAKPQPLSSPVSQPVSHVTDEPSLVSEELPKTDDESSETSEDRWIW
jgi:hypothetical protein